MNLPQVALIGMPNVGKSALFNRLTGSFQRVANFAGATVEKASSSISLDGQELALLTDLPGLYSMDVATLEEKITRDLLLGKLPQYSTANILLVVDATHLEKSLYLVLQILELGHKPIIALNQMDIYRRRGGEINLTKLSQLLGTDIVAVSAASGEGIEALKELLAQRLQKPVKSQAQFTEGYNKQIASTDYVAQKFAQIDKIIKEVTVKSQVPDTFTEKVDRWVLHPVWGMLILALILLLMFQALFTWATPAMDGIESFFGLLSEVIENSVNEPLLKSLLIDGIIAGVGGVVVFLPQIVLMFLFIQFLEDVGYLARVAYLMDAFMRRLGLPGKAVIPLLSSHSCAIPGILSTRILDNPVERLVSMLVLPITTCSARLPVFTLLIAAIIPATAVWGPFTMQGLAMFGLYIFAVVCALLLAWALKKVFPSSGTSMLLMEVPPYRMPKLSGLLKGMWNKASLFLTKAGKFILLLSVLIWFLVSFPRNSQGEFAPIDESYAASIGKAFAPVFKPLGFDWKINTALIPSMGAREVLVSALGTVFAIEDAEGEDGFVMLQHRLSEEYPASTLWALLIWFVFAPQCISTFAAMRRETGGWKWPAVMGAYTMGLAWVMAFITNIALR